MSKHSELKRLAEAANPEDCSWEDVFQYISAAKPSVVLAILAELEALRVEAETLRRQNYQRKTSGLRERSHKPIVYREQA